MKIILSVFVITLMLSTKILLTEAYCYVQQTYSDNCDGATRQECTDCFCYDKILHCCSIGHTVEELPEGCKLKKVGCYEIAVKIDDENEECTENVSFVLK